MNKRKATPGATPAESNKERRIGIRERGRSTGCVEKKQ